MRRWLLPVVVALGALSPSHSRADMMIWTMDNCGLHGHGMAVYYYCEYDVTVDFTNPNDVLNKVEGHININNTWEWIGRISGSEIVDLGGGVFAGGDCMDLDGAAPSGHDQNVHCQQDGSGPHTMKCEAYKVGMGSAALTDTEEWRP